MSTFDKLISRYGSFQQRHYSHEVLWPHWDLLHVHSGELTILHSGDSLTISQGDSILIPPETLFRIQNGDSTTTASVQYFIPVENTVIEYSLKRIRKPYIFRNSTDNSIEPHIQELMKLYNPQCSIARIQELLLELILEKILSDKYNEKNIKIPWGELINKYITMLEQPPTIEMIAGWAGYSPSRFRVIFQRDIGIQPVRYFLNLRMEHASKMLIETLLPIKQIAQKHGYNEVSHFNRAFSKHYGISPGRYRKKYAFWG